MKFSSQGGTIPGLDVTPAEDASSPEKKPTLEDTDSRQADSKDSTAVFHEEKDDKIGLLLVTKFNYLLYRT